MAGFKKTIGSGKRSHKSTEIPSKKRKLGSTSTNPQKKLKASERSHIPVPVFPISGSVTEEEDLDDEDLAFFAKTDTAGFLGQLDTKAISRSKHEQFRIHKLQKPRREKRQYDDLPAIEDHEADLESWSSGIDESEIEENASDEDGSSISPPIVNDNSDMEQEYEKQARKRGPSWDEDKTKGSARLPLKMADGTLKHRGNLPAREEVIESSVGEDEDFEIEEDWAKDDPRKRAGVEDVATGARFGRPAVVDVISNTSRRHRIQGAKEQLAGICQEIVADPESSLGLLRRLHTFSLPFITTPSHPQPVANDPVIQKLALLSQLAVFKDIIPGYRIRPLSEQEKGEKVSQLVQRTREYEQGLVSVYQSYLQMLDKEIKDKSDLSDIALHSMCTLLTEATHFNFRVNIMSAIVSRLSRRSWDANSDLCLKSLISVFRNDTSGVVSLEIMRLMNRMIKERHFRVHPNTLSCLLHLRLRNELGGVRASGEKASFEGNEKIRKPRFDRDRKGKRKGKDDSKPYLSKKAKKTLKEKKVIEKELQEAAAEVDKEDRAIQQTETLKLLFVLYFRILKNTHPTPLLPGALEGLARYAHLVNIDFFRDLLGVLKELVLQSNARRQVDEDRNESDAVIHDAEHLRHRLLCISTAFELLSGQGEALTIDLHDFVNHLYSIILELAVSPDIEDVPSTSGMERFKQGPRPSKISSRSTADLLFRTLSLVFNSRTPSSNTPPWRTAAFAKRLMICCLSWPPTTARRTIEFVKTLLVKEPRLEALLSTDDRTADGVYRAELDDPQLANPFGSSFWELRMLGAAHWDQNVRAEANKLASFSKS